MDEILNKIHNCDCIEFMKNKIEDKSIDLIIEDRPYGKLPKNKVAWDSTFEFKGIFDEYFRILKDNGQLVIWGQQPMISFILIEAINSGFEYRFEVIWEKPGASWSSNHIPLKVHEQFIVLKKSKAKVSDCTFNLKDIMTEGTPYYKDCSNSVDKNSVQNIKRKNMIVQNNGIRYPRSVLKAPSKQYMKKKFRTEHPTQKPLDISDWQVKALSNEGDIIYIPFGGSGTEIVSSKNLNRNYIATELNNEYIENIILSRLDKE